MLKGEGGGAIWLMRGDRDCENNRGEKNFGLLRLGERLLMCGSTGSAPATAHSPVASAWLVDWRREGKGKTISTELLSKPQSRLECIVFMVLNRSLMSICRGRRLLFIKRFQVLQCISCTVVCNGMIVTEPQS
jgi:hypothetical protein